MGYENHTENNFEKEEEKSITPDEIIIEPVKVEYSDVEVITDIIFDGKKDVTIKDMNYMCSYISEYEGCENCPIFINKSHCPFVVLLKYFDGSASNLNETILNWLHQNPPKSFLMDIKHRMPNVELDEPYNVPKFCVKNIYGTDCCECAHSSDNYEYKTSDMLCRACWRQPMEKTEL